MTRRSKYGRLLRGRFVTRVGPALALAATAAAITGGGGSSVAGGSEPEASYAVLEEEAGPTGLQIGPPAPGPAGPGETPVPTLPETAPEGAGNWPVASSVRRLETGSTGMSAWIARSSEGGVCVLFYDGTPVEGVAALDVGCSTEEGLDRGASIEVSEIPGQPGEVIAVGVVPDGVTSVSEVLADESTATSPVSGNAWIRVGTEPAAPGEIPNETRGS